jgi:hypothetical protein
MKRNLRFSTDRSLLLLLLLLFDTIWQRDAAMVARPLAKRPVGAGGGSLTDVGDHGGRVECYHIA